MKPSHFLLLSSVALQGVLLFAPAFAAEPSAIVVAQSEADDRLAAARRALEQAQKALQQAEDTGGDVRSARRNVADAMRDLRTTEATTGSGAASPAPAAKPSTPPPAVTPAPAAAAAPSAAPAGPKPYQPPTPPPTPKAEKPVDERPKAVKPAEKPAAEKPPAPRKAAPAAPAVPPRSQPPIEPPRRDNGQPAPQGSYPPPRPSAPTTQPLDRPVQGSPSFAPPISGPAGGRPVVEQVNRDGSRIEVTRDREGRVLRRVRIDRYGVQTILFDASRIGGPRPPMAPPGYDGDNQPPEIGVPEPLRPSRPGFVLNGDNASEADIEKTLRADPIERPSRGYTLDEIRRDPNVRNMVRRIDIDTITFEFGSDQVPEDQIRKLNAIGRALGRIIDRNPDEIFLIEGHTDAVGTDLANLELSDRRARSVADILSSYFDIPPENLASQGYGERDLKVPTDGPERLNRRVTIRRITPLLRGRDY